MKMHIALIAALAGGVLVLTHRAEPPALQEAPRVVLGTFDSRAVAIAHVRSEEFQEHLRGLHAELQRAEAAGDTAEVERLKALGPELQARIHRQGFGNAPIDDILVLLDDALPRIAAEAGVDVIVSRWDVTWQAPSARTVDVSEALAAEFHPDEATWKTIREIMRKDPVPLDQLNDH